jgi:hypothetical protein
MDIGIGLPATIPWTNAPLILEWAKRADSSPFSSLGILDRLVYPNYEPLITLAAAAAVTERVRLMTTVLIAPLRRAGVLAKQAATIDALSGGRLTLGVGVGAREDDFQFAPASFHDRGRRFDEQLELMKRVWSGQPVSEEVGAVGPPPARPGGPELLIGGYTPVSIRRVGRWGDGFISGGVRDLSRCASCSTLRRNLGGMKEEQANRASSLLSTMLSVRTLSVGEITSAITTATLGQAPMTWQDPSRPPRRQSRGSSRALATSAQTK